MSESEMRELLARLSQKEQEEQRKLLNEALTKKQPINLAKAANQRQQPFLGDEIIECLPVMYLIRQYAKEEKLTAPIFIYDAEQAYRTYKGPEKFFRIEGLFNAAMGVLQPHIIVRATESYVKTLNTELPKRPIPQLEQIKGHPFFDSFSRKDVDNLKKEIKRTINHPFSVIVQAGSAPVKRWSPEQVEKLITAIAENPLLPQPIILSDAQFQGKPEEVKALQKIEKEKGVKVIFFTSPEELCAYLGLAEFTAGTDSGPCWVWEAEHQEEAKALFHHTVTDKYWKAPSASGFFSSAVWRSKMIDRGYITGGLTEYAKNFGIKKEEIVAPAKEDFAEYCKRLSQFGRPI